jgi:predicted kinase
MLLKGLPGCGKSTFAKNLLKKENGRWKRFNRDDLRNMIDDGQYTKENEEFVVEVQDKLIRQALQDGFDVILDNTHLVPMTVKKLHKLAESVGDVQVLEKGFNETVETCLKRNAERQGRARVPDDVIHRMAKAAGIDRGKKLEDKTAYYPPRDNAAPGGDQVEADDALPKAILCDLDGTWVRMGNRSPYDGSQCDVLDHPNWPVIITVLMAHSHGINIIFMSGRDSKYREQTIRQIEMYARLENLAKLQNAEVMPAVTELISYQLHMRGEGDMRKDSLVKSDLFDEHVRGKFNVLFVLDDRDQVVSYWRSIGLTCFQVDYGNF